MTATRHDVPRSLWAQQVHAAALELSSRLSLVTLSDEEQHPRDAEIVSRSRESIRQALAAADRRPSRWPWPRLHEWWTGSRVETCWAHLHDAEVLLADVHDPEVWQATVRSALDHSHRLPPDDVDVVALAAALRRYAS